MSHKSRVQGHTAMNVNHVMLRKIAVRNTLSLRALHLSQALDGFPRKGIMMIPHRETNETRKLMVP